MDGNQKILVVDDDPTICELLQEALEGEGFDAITATKGEKGWEYFSLQHPDAVVIDALMPGMNGFELATKIRNDSHGRDIPIVMISGVYKAMKMHDQIKHLDINDFIEKPFDFRILSSRLKELFQVSFEKPLEQEFVALEGDLTETPFPKILYMLYRRKMTGTLLLSRGRLKKKLTIEKGSPKFVESNLVQECLGKQLVRRGRLSQEECDESLRLMKQHKTRQGETLIKMGVLNPNELDEALKEQARDKVIEIFAWIEGTYKFTESSKVPGELTPLDLSLPQTILRGVRAGYSLERLRQELVSYTDKEMRWRDDTVFQLDDFRLATWDNRIVREMERKGILKNLINSKVAREIDVYGLIFALYCLDMIEFDETKAMRKSKALINRYRRIASELEQQDYFHILGVSSTANNEEIDESYDRLVETYDSTPMPPENQAEVKKLLRGIKSHLKKAHRTLVDKDQRKNYERQLYFDKGVMPIEPERVFNPDVEIKMIKGAMDRGDFDQAEKDCEKILQLFPKDWRFHVQRAVCIFKSNYKKGERDEDAMKPAIAVLARAIKLAPLEADGYFHLGEIYKAIGDETKALNFYKKTLEIKPQHHEAESAVRLLQMREDKKSKSFIKWK